MAVWPSGLKRRCNRDGKRVWVRIPQHFAIYDLKFYYLNLENIQPLIVAWIVKSIKRYYQHLGKANFFDCILNFDTVLGCAQSSAVLTTAKLLLEM